MCLSFYISQTRGLFAYSDLSLQVQQPLRITTVKEQGANFHHWKQEGSNAARDGLTATRNQHKCTTGLLDSSHLWQCSCCLAGWRPLRSYIAPAKAFTCRCFSFRQSRMLQRWMGGQHCSMWGIGSLHCNLPAQEQYILHPLDPSVNLDD